MQYTCTTPKPDGTGNISADPLFIDAAAGNYRLAAGSPCIDVGNNNTTYLLPHDSDGNPRIVSGTVDIGSYEALPPVVGITNHVVSGASCSLGGTNSEWVVGTMEWTNTANAAFGEFSAGGGPAYGWQVSSIPLKHGNNTITVSGTNVYGIVGSDQILIRRAVVEDTGASPVHYLSTSGASIWPYTNWTDAATVIQDAVDTASSNDTVLVTNGVYNAGEAVTPGYDLRNRVTVTRAITVASVNGCDVTTIMGQQNPAAVDLYASGSNHYVRIEHAAALDLGKNYTLEAWIYPRSFNWLGGIIDKYHSSGSPGYLLRLSGSAPYTGLTIDAMSTTNGVLESNQWVRVAAVNDNGTRRLYVNGVEEALTGTPLAVTNNTDPVCIGVDYLSSPRYFDGIIDEVRIWNVARTKIQIQGSMTQTLSADESGLAGYWRLDTGTGTNAVDSTANDNNGALMNGAPWSTANVAPLQKMRCVYLVDGALLSGFTLTKGGTLATGEYNMDRGGGGVLCNGGGAVSNCVITGCSADVFGGGADLHHGGDLSHCIIRGNHSRVDGGGAVVEEGRIVNSLFIGNSADSDGGGCTIWDKGLLENCTLSGNGAVGTGGGVHVEHTGTNRNSIIYGNTAATGNEAYQGTLESCFTNNPLFVGGDDYHLQGGSPCIDAGNNQAWMAAATDLDGNPRIFDGDFDSTATVDMGVYEWTENPPVAGFGTALEFDGTNDCVELPTGLATAIGGGDAITIEYWFKGSQFQSPVRFQDGTGYIVAGWNSSNPKHIISTDGGVSGGLSCGDESVIENGQWHHLAMVWERNTVNGFRSYLDGERVAQRDSADVTLPTATPYLGSMDGTSEFLEGALDEVRIWNAALSSNAISAWMYREVDATHPAYSNLVACYRLNEESGTDAADCAGGYDGTLLNMAASAWVGSDVRNWTVFEGATLAGRLVGSDLDGASSNGTDWVLGFEIVDPPALGTATTTVDNVFEYTASLGVAGQDSFTYRVRDPDDNLSNVHTVSVTVVAHAPLVTITNPVGPVTVDDETLSIAVQGTNNPYVVGAMWWTNAANGANGTLAASSEWSVPSVPLAMGDNVITVSGTNKIGEVASDSVVATRVTWHGGDSPIHYVATNGAAVWPYTNWATAATCIQDAVDAAASNDTVLVTNGVYNAGGAVTPGYGLTNRVAITREVTLESVNGPDDTFIVGAADPLTTNGPAAVRGVYAGVHAVVSGFTVTNGHTRASGHYRFERSGGGASFCIAEPSSRIASLRAIRPVSLAGGCSTGMERCI